MTEANGAPRLLSPAHTDEAAGIKLKGDWSSNPGLDSTLAARLLVTSATDHLQSLAAVLRMPGGGGIFGTYTVARGALETSARAWDLLGPGLPIRERVRRHMNERLHSLNEARALLSGIDGTHAQQDDQEEKILRSAKQHSFEVHRARKYKAAYLDTPRPRVGSLADVCLQAYTGEKQFGHMVYRLLSAHAHGVSYGLLQLLGPPEDLQQATRPGVVAQQVRHSSIEVATRLLVPLVVYTAMMQRFLVHYGWRDARYEVALQRALRVWLDVALASETDGRDAAGGADRPDQ